MGKHTAGLRCEALLEAMGVQALEVERFTRLVHPTHLTLHPRALHPCLPDPLTHNTYWTEQLLLPWQ